MQQLGKGTLNTRNSKESWSQICQQYQQSDRAKKQKVTTTIAAGTSTVAAAVEDEDKNFDNAVLLLSNTYPTCTSSSSSESSSGGSDPEEHNQCCDEQQYYPQRQPVNHCNFRKQHQQRDEDSLSTNAQPGGVSSSGRESTKTNESMALVRMVSPSNLQAEEEYDDDDDDDDDDMITAAPSFSDTDSTTLSACADQILSSLDQEPLLLQQQHQQQQLPQQQISEDSWDNLLELVQDKFAPASELLLTLMNSTDTLHDSTEHAEPLEAVKSLLLRQQQQQQQKQQQGTNRDQVLATAAFFHGLALHQNIYEKKMRELHDQHRQQILLLQHANPPPPPPPLAGNSNHDDHFRIGSQEQRKQQQQQQQANQEEEEAFDTRTVCTTFSTMSCRELSIARYQRARRIRRRQQEREQTKDQQQTNSDGKDQERKNQPSRPANNNSDNKVDDENDTDSENEKIQQLLEELQLAERRRKKLELQLQQAGVVLAEDIPYQEAKDQVERISKRMNEIGDSQIVVHNDAVLQQSLRQEYFRLEKDMEKYMTALMLTDEYQEEQRSIENAWEAAQVDENRRALEQIRRHMPADIRKMTQADLHKAGLSTEMAKKFHRTNVLQILRRDPDAVARWHPCNLESLRLAGLTLTERRALHHYMVPIMEGWCSKTTTTTTTMDAMTERKVTWARMMKANFKERLTKYQQHVDQTDGMTCCIAHKCDLIGRQCPVRANAVVDYSGDLGFPEGDVYEESVVRPARKSRTEITASLWKSSGSQPLPRAQDSISVPNPPNAPNADADSPNNSNDAQSTMVADDLDNTISIKEVDSSFPKRKPDGTRRNSSLLDAIRARNQSGA